MEQPVYVWAKFEVRSRLPVTEMRLPISLS